MKAQWLRWEIRQRPVAPHALSLSLSLTEIMQSSPVTSNQVWKRIWRAFCVLIQDSGKAVSLGLWMEEMIFNLADSRLFFNDLEVSETTKLLWIECTDIRTSALDVYINNHKKWCYYKNTDGLVYIVRKEEKSYIYGSLFQYGIKQLN